MKIHALFYDILQFLLFQGLFKDWVKIKFFFLIVCTNPVVDVRCYNRT